MLVFTYALRESIVRVYLYVAIYIPTEAHECMAHSKILYDNSLVVWYAKYQRKTNNYPGLWLLHVNTQHHLYGISVVLGLQEFMIVHCYCMSTSKALPTG